MRLRIKLFLALVVLFTAALALLFAASLLGLRLPRRAFVTDGPIAALTLPADQLAAAEVPAALAAAAAGSGANTLLAALESAQGALFSDRALPDTGRETDPLNALCAAAKEAGVQVFAHCSPALGGDLPLDEQGALLRRLLRHYPIAGLILSADGVPAADLAALAGAIGNPPGGRALGLLITDGRSPDAALGAFSPLFIETGDSAQLAAWRAACPDALVLPAAGGELFADAALLREEGEGGLAGALLGSLELTGSDPGRLALLMSYFDPLPAAGGLALSGALTVGYPADGTVTTADSIVVLGLCDGAQPLTLSAGSLRRAAGGAFAAEVPLEEGENTITLSQGAETRTLTVTRRIPQGGGYDGPVPDTRLDETLAGRTVEVTAQLASALSDPASDGAIAMTLYQGARARLRGSAQTLRGGQIVTVYQLSSGDWLLAENARLLEEDEGGEITLAAPSVAETGREISFTFAGGTPVCYDARGEKTLTLTFWDAALGFDPALLACRYVTAATAAPLEDAEGARLTLTLAEDAPLWGYEVSYADGATTLTLTGAPEPSGEPGRPLAGLTVLLDPGHGGADAGALGIGGGAGAPEKAFNLALAGAAADRLTQLGAAVVMTRTGDDARSLQQRWDDCAALRPDLFLALHHNSTALITDTGAAGVEAYYFEPGSAALAGALSSAVSAATGRADGGARWSYFYVTRTTRCPAVLLELGYLSDPDEFESCASAGGLQAAADGIAVGILAALG